MRLITHAADRYAILIPVTDDGEPFDLAPATLIEVVAQREGFAPVAATVSVIDAAAGLMVGTFAAETLAPGDHRVQVRITAPGGLKTVADFRLVVERSLDPPV